LEAEFFCTDEFTLQKTFSFADDDKILHLYGEIKNRSDRAMTDVVVEASFYEVKCDFLNMFQ
jgi:hypothetical protein